MPDIKLRVKRLPHCKALPGYATEGASGLDLCAAIAEPLTLSSRERKRVPTGVIIAIPEGYEGQVRARSGLADRAGLGLTNGIGTIDADYRGEVQVLMINHGLEPYTIQPGDRIAQLVLMPVPKVEIEEVEELTATGRGEGGFGSTGTGSPSKTTGIRGEL
jgi:dUTP pyrophosphatase